jgi:hypothetical protein
MSVMTVQEKCDEKVGRKAAALGSVESQPFGFAQGRLWGTGLDLKGKEFTRAANGPLLKACVVAHPS